MTKQEPQMYICPKAKECKKRCITHHNKPHVHNEECDFDTCIEWPMCGLCIPVEPEGSCYDEGDANWKPQPEVVEKQYPHNVCTIPGCSCKTWQPTPTEKMSLIKADSKFETSRFYHGATLQLEKDMAWLPVHDSEVASKAVKEFASILSEEQLRKIWNDYEKRWNGKITPSQIFIFAYKAAVDEAIRAMAEEGR